MKTPTSKKALTGEVSTHSTAVEVAASCCTCSTDQSINLEVIKWKNPIDFDTKKKMKNKFTPP